MGLDRIFWRLAISFVALSVAAVVAMANVSVAEVRSFFVSQLENELMNRAGILSRAESAGQPRDSLCELAGESSLFRATVIDTSGTVLCDSWATADLMDNHSDRHEVQQAMAAGHGTSVRVSSSVERELLYVALRSPESGAVIRLAAPTSEIADVVENVARSIRLGGSMVVLVALLLAFLVSQRLSSPLEDLKQSAELIASGVAVDALPEIGTTEVAALSKSLNRMVSVLEQQVSDASGKRRELETVLDSMHEGVIAVDSTGTVFNMNPAAESMLELDRVVAVGSLLTDVVTDRQLCELIGNVLDSTITQRQEINLGNGTETRIIRTIVTPLQDMSGTRNGALIVMDDVTQVRRLEAIRRDFVANVSHELKTPVTSIKGYAETLLELGAEDPESAEKFARIIARQSDRLNGIIDDLLSLARLERLDESDRHIDLEKHEIADIIERAFEVCGMAAEERRIVLRKSVNSGLCALVDEELIEQAIVNLVTNAIKYGPPDSTVEVDAVLADKTVTISVRDAGPGIESQHLPRLFERFYRVDTGRSRQMGGTGLGLAIVKHIAQVHGGRVTVDSRVGEGTAFTLHIPQQGDGDHA